MLRGHQLQPVHPRREQWAVSSKLGLTLSQRHRIEDRNSVGCGNNLIKCSITMMGLTKYLNNKKNSYWKGLNVKNIECLHRKFVLICVQQPRLNQGPTAKRSQPAGDICVMPGYVLRHFCIILCVGGMSLWNIWTILNKSKWEWMESQARIFYRHSLGPCLPWAWDIQSSLRLRAQSAATMRDVQRYADIAAAIQRNH